MKSLIRADEREMEKKNGYIKRWWEDDEAEEFSKGGSKRARPYKRWDSPGRVARGSGSGSDRSCDSHTGPPNKRGVFSGPGRKEGEEMGAFLARRAYEEHGITSGRWAGEWTQHAESSRGRDAQTAHGKGGPTDAHPDAFDPYDGAKDWGTVNVATNEQRRSWLNMTTTNDWTAAVRDSLDEKNLRRMVKMNMLAQELIIRVYRQPADGANKPQAHLQTTMRGVRKILEDGITNEERNRLIALTCTGTKVSYKPCTWHGKGHCRRRAACHHIHTAYGKGKGKGMGKGFFDEDSDE